MRQTHSQSEGALLRAARRSVHADTPSAPFDHSAISMIRVCFDFRNSDFEFQLSRYLGAPASNPKGAIESPVLDRFADMFGGDFIARLEIGDRARHF